MKSLIEIPERAYRRAGETPMPAAARIAFSTDAWLMPWTAISSPTRTTNFCDWFSATKFLLQRPPIRGVKVSGPCQNGNERIL